MGIANDYGENMSCVGGTGEQFIIDGKNYIKCKDVRPLDNEGVYIIRVRLPSNKKNMNLFYPATDVEITEQILSAFKFIK